MPEFFEADSFEILLKYIETGDSTLRNARPELLPNLLQMSDYLCLPYLTPYILGEMKSIIPEQPKHWLTFYRAIRPLQESSDSLVQDLIQGVRGEICKIVPKIIEEKGEQLEVLRHKLHPMELSKLYAHTLNICQSNDELELVIMEAMDYLFHITTLPLFLAQVIYHIYIYI